MHMYYKYLYANKWTLNPFEISEGTEYCQKPNTIELVQVLKLFGSGGC